MTRRQAFIIFAIGAGLFGFTPIFAKLNFAAGHSLADLVVTQMICGSLILWFIFFIRNKQIAVTKRNVMHIMIAGSLNGITGILYYSSMQYVPASIAIILLFQFVWVGIIYEWILDKKTPVVATYITVILTLIGVFFAANVYTGSFTNLPFMGIVFGLLSAFSYAGFIFVSGRVATHVDPVLRAPLMITGSLVLVFILFRPTTFLFTEAIMSTAWLYGLGGALFGAVIPPLCFAISAPYLSSSLATILGSIELPVAVIAASIILSENVSAWQWFGIILIIFAISFNELLTNWRTAIKKRKLN